MINVYSENQDNPIVRYEQRIRDVRSAVQFAQQELFESCIRTNMPYVFEISRVNRSVDSARGVGKTTVLSNISKKYNIPIIVSSDYLKNWTVNKFNLREDRVYSVQTIVHRDEFFYSAMFPHILVDEISYGFYRDYLMSGRIKTLFGCLGYVTID